MINVNKYLNCLNYSYSITSVSSGLMWKHNWISDLACGRWEHLHSRSNFLYSLFLYSLSVPLSRLHKTCFQSFLLLHSPTLTTQHTVDKADVEGRCKIFQMKWEMWNNCLHSLLSFFWVSEYRATVDNAILWFLWKSFLGKFKKVIV